jgi:hypothetical protein
MTVYQAPADIDLTARINAELGAGALQVTVDRYDLPGGAMHGLCFQHGQRRGIVSRSQPWTAADITEIVASARRWQAQTLDSPRERWVDSHEEADALPDLS